MDELEQAWNESNGQKAHLKAWPIFASKFHVDYVDPA